MPEDEDEELSVVLKNIQQQATALGEYELADHAARMLARRRLERLVSRLRARHP